MAAFQPNNKIIILTAPSGAGKTSITRFLLKEFPQLAFSVSAATRNCRSTEKNGVDYYFMTAEDFNRKIQHNEFVEWEMVYEGNYYGTLKSELDRLWNNQQVPVLDIDVKGAIHVQEQYPDSTLSIFIEPPSIEELRKRLSSRGSETEETLQTRLNKAAYEISFKHHFRKIILNDDFTRACSAAKEVVQQFLES
jgi:guanylate kinase